MGYDDDCQTSFSLDGWNWNWYSFSFRKTWLDRPFNENACVLGHSITSNDYFPKDSFFIIPFSIRVYILSLILLYNAVEVDTSQ